LAAVFLSSKSPPELSSKSPTEDLLSKYPTEGDRYTSLQTFFLKEGYFSEGFLSSDTEERALHWLAKGYAS
jgi:hypothetical protein